MLGDSAWLYRVGDGDAGLCLRGALDLASRLRQAGIEGVTDVINGYNTVAVHTDPAVLDEVGEVLRGLTVGPTGEEFTGRQVEIPVLYGGPDLKEAARRLGMEVEEVIRLHTGAEMRVATLGFAPGFPYLAGLPEALHLPRKATPERVGAGAVAIAGAQGGIYPCESPAGWWVLGKTTATLFDPGKHPPSILMPGDRVRFVQVDVLKAPREAAGVDFTEGPVEVIEPGAITTVQDGGRPGYRDAGVSPGGAADPVALAVANTMLGNVPEAPALEVCLTGPLLRFREPCRVAWVGWKGGGRSADFGAGETLDLRAGLAAVRGVVAFAGGLEVPRCLGSAATDLRGKFGGLDGRALCGGDRLQLGERPVAGADPGAWRIGWPAAPGGTIELRVVRGVQAHWFQEGQRRAFLTRGFRVSTTADRMGVRLEGCRMEVPEKQMVSQPTVPGSVQVPPDGLPIVLLNECQTLGGYPQIAHVISADLPLLARAWPGTVVHFREVDPATAARAWLELKTELRRLRVGLDFLTRRGCGST